MATPFAVGSHSVSASYSGDNSYNATTTAAPITFTVIKDTPEVIVSASNAKRHSLSRRG